LSSIKAKITGNIIIYVDLSCEIIKCNVSIYVRAVVLYIIQRVSV